MGDKIGKIPKITSKKKALKEIVFIASDNRQHVMKDDCIEWLELKMQAIKKVAEKGLDTK